MTEAIKFQSSTMLQNYKRLLTYIESQMDTDEIDRAERRVDTMKTYIRYYLEHMDDHYKWILYDIIPLEILKEKILDVEFGFGDPESSDDTDLYSIIKESLHCEICYRDTICKCGSIDTTKFYECWQCMVRDCGCKADPSCCGKY